jgi:hypothetical protein
MGAQHARRRKRKAKAKQMGMPRMQAAGYFLRHAVYASFVCEPRSSPEKILQNGTKKVAGDFAFSPTER